MVSFDRGELETIAQKLVLNLKGAFDITGPGLLSMAENISTLKAYDQFN